MFLLLFVVKMLPRFLCFFSSAVFPSAAYARVTARDMYSLYGVASNSDSASFTLLFRLLKGSKTERTTLAAKLGSTERLLSLLLGPLTPRHSLSLDKLEINQKATVEQLCHVSFAPLLAPHGRISMFRPNLIPVALRCSFVVPLGTLLQ